MPRAPSIPADIYNSILKRWAVGESPQAIVDWIDRTNWRRAKPVQTSRSSVERLIQRAELKDTRRNSFAVVARLRRQAPAQLEILDTLPARYDQLAQEMDAEVVKDPENLKAIQARFQIQLRTLARQEMLASRRLRLAGLSGTAVHRWEKANAEALNEIETDVADETAAELVAEAFLADLSGAVEDLTAPPVTPEPAAPESPTAQNDVRLESESATETSTNESSIEVPSEPWTGPTMPLPIPLVRMPAWPLTPEQEAEWKHQQVAINTFLLLAFREDAPNPPALLPGEQPPARADDLGSRVVPMMELPNWRLTPAQRMAMEKQVRETNGWLAWLRRKITRDSERYLAETEKPRTAETAAKDQPWQPRRRV